MSAASQDQIEADNAWFARLRARIPNPSARNPNMSWESNEADQIERQMQDDGHRSWGFVVYRTTYDSDGDWAEFLRRLRFRTEEAFDMLGGRDVLGRHALTVFSDRGRFEGAGTDDVRRHFQRWAVDSYRAEQGPRASGEGDGGEGDGGDRDWDGDGVHIGRSQRYRYALMVDAEALRSVVHDAPAPPEVDATRKGWVKLIDKSWYLGTSEGRYRPAHAFPALEGVTEEDVGWVKIPYWTAMSEWYSKLRGPNAWGNSYQRPPAIAGGDFLSG